MTLDANIRDLNCFLRDIPVHFLLFFCHFFVVIHSYPSLGYGGYPYPNQFGYKSWERGKKLFVRDLNRFLLFFVLEGIRVFELTETPFAVTSYIRLNSRSQICFSVLTFFGSHLLLMSGKVEEDNDLCTIEKISSQ